jgi:tRNA A37 threonylcarbamoyladenosine modification protein TsaB
LEVHGVCSAEALADQVLAEFGVPAVTVLGDARRGAFWAAAYERRNGHTVPRHPIALIPDAELGSASAADPALWVTPDWARIGPRLQALRPEAARLVPARRVPDAITVGRLALARRRRGQPPEPALPLYLHPPVAAAPVPDGANPKEAHAP